MKCQAGGRGDWGEGVGIPGVPPLWKVTKIVTFEHKSLKIGYNGPRIRWWGAGGIRDDSLFR